VHMT